MMNRTTLVGAAITALAVGIAVALIDLALGSLLGPPEAPFWIHDGVLIGTFAFVAARLDARRKRTRASKSSAA